MIVFQAALANTGRYSRGYRSSALVDAVPSNVKYQCKECGRFYSSPAALRVHVKMHKGVYTYRCQYCGRGFAATNNLKGHLAKHTGVKAFKCHICKEEFSYGNVLKDHMQKQHPLNGP